MPAPACEAVTTSGKREEISKGATIVLYGYAAEILHASDHFASVLVAQPLGRLGLSLTYSPEPGSGRDDLR